MELWKVKTIWKGISKGDANESYMIKGMAAGPWANSKASSTKGDKKKKIIWFLP